MIRFTILTVGIATYICSRMPHVSDIGWIKWGGILVGIIAFIVLIDVIIDAVEDFMDVK